MSSHTWGNKITSDGGGKKDIVRKVTLTKATFRVREAFYMYEMLA